MARTSEPSLNMGLRLTSRPRMGNQIVAPRTLVLLSTPRPIPEGCHVTKRAARPAKSPRPAGKWVVEVRLPGDAEWQVLATPGSGSGSAGGQEPRLWKYDRAHLLAGAIERGFPGMSARVARPPGAGETVRLFRLPRTGMPGSLATILGVSGPRQARRSPAAAESAEGPRTSDKD